MLHTALTGVSSASHQHPYWSENLSNKLVMSSVLLLFAVLQSVLSPQGRQCMQWNFPSLHLLIKPSFYIGSGAQQATKCFWALPSHKPSSVRAAWRRHLEHSAQCLSYTLALDELSHGHLLTILTTAVCSSAAGPLTCSITTLNSWWYCSTLKVRYQQIQINGKEHSKIVTESTLRRLLLSFPPILLLQSPSLTAFSRPCFG